jgi:hypothetical protein
MVVPVTSWCADNGFIIELAENGQTKTYCDYFSAITRSSELSVVVNKVNEMLTEYGTFRLKDLETVMQSGSEYLSEDAVVEASGVDILIRISFRITPVGSKTSVTLDLKAIDAHSKAYINGSGGRISESMNPDLEAIVFDALFSEMENFASKMNEYFRKLETEGRLVVVNVVLDEGYDGDLTDEYDGDDLRTILDNWMYDNSVLNNANEGVDQGDPLKVAVYEVAIPLYDENQRALKARGFATDLKAFLRKNYGIESTVEGGVADATIKLISH